MKKRNAGRATWAVVPLTELVGTHHDTRPPCALCAALLAEGVLGEGSIMESLMNAGVTFWAPSYHRDGE